ncbi:hypothetical protein ACLNGM_02240 [Aureimonas phyllosphaerae]|uniref:hypothetical protein n=1 Tax=Aureimonas phyllosphaerae TaxID=1166078 RepID=UPI003A5C42DB
MAIVLEANDDGEFEIPVVGSVPRLHMAMHKNGVALIGQTTKVLDNGRLATLRIQLTNRAIEEALGLLLHYAEEINLEPKPGAGPRKGPPFN